MRIVAILVTHNERRFVARCIEHLHAHGVDVYVIDNESTDDTVKIVERYHERGVIGLESMPRGQHWDLQRQLERKQELAGALDADWLLHVDADEIREPADPRQSLADALRCADEQGFNAVNFFEFTFVPTAEHPEHDHPHYERSMRSYYPFLPGYPHRLNAWKRQEGPVDLLSSGGHQVDFPGLLMSPRNLVMRHYLFLSVEHAREKYILNGRIVSGDEHHWGGWRADLDPARIRLPSEHRLRRYVPGEALDRSEPVTEHPLFERPDSGPLGEEHGQAPGHVRPRAH